jgi:hypothetical protein
MSDSFSLIVLQIDFVKMGADASLPLSPVSHDLSMTSITFREGDRVTVLHLDGAGLSAIGQAIKDTWHAGIQAEQSRCATGWSFKLNGYPFTKSSTSTARQCRQMAMRILQNMHGIGYGVLASGTLGSEYDRSTLFFKKSPSNTPAPRFFCLSFNDSDKIQFTNLPSQLAASVKDAIRASWNLGIQSVDDQDGVLQFKLAGRPWVATNNNQSIAAKILLQALFATLHRHQWVYHVNVNLNRDQDCLIFRHEPKLNTYSVPQFFMMGFGQGDRLRLIGGAPGIADIIRRVIEAKWNPGRIQDERDFHGSHEFKISGNPWNSVLAESARARYLMLEFFQELLRYGWHNVAAFCLSRVSSDRVVLLFEKREPLERPMFCIAPHDSDKFWLINMSAELVSLFKRVLRSRWSNGTQSEKEIALHFGTVHNLKLIGKPWSGGESNSPIHARSFLCSIIEEFAKVGWELMLCVDVTSRMVAESDGPDYPLDVYSFWFAYTAMAEMAQPSAPPQNHVFGEQASPYPPPGAGFGVAGAPPPMYSEPPPTYSEATGWDSQGTKE